MFVSLKINIGLSQMKKYHTILFFVLAVIIGITYIVTSPEFYDFDNGRVHLNSIKAVQEEDAELRKLYQNIKISQPLQPTLASTMSQVFIIPQPDMPNNFISVRYPNQQYISYTTTHI
jgi:uncharacterized ion transporter superfamily protein YfcC